MVRSMRSIWLLAVLLLAAIPRPARSDAGESAYREAREALLKLIDDENAKRYRDRWERVIRALDDAAKKVSRADLRCAAWYNGARAFAEMSKVSYLAKDREEAFRRYRAVADRCPSSNLADDALYRAAEIYLERDPGRARTALEEMVRRFPKGDMVPLARERLAELPPASRERAVAKPEAPKAPAPAEEPSPGSNLPSAADILAAMEASQGHAGEGGGERVEAIEKLIGGEMPFSVVAGLKIRRVVIDPGHGGKDTGAIGPDGAKEKDLTLAMAKKLRAYLEEKGLEVLLTREGDRTLSLEERTRFANEKGADLFLSLHVNAAQNRKAHGIETYTLNLNSDRYAMRLAARENASSERRIGELQFILADLATKANTDDSVKLARLVQSKMVSRLQSRHGKDRIRDLGVKQALFFVLVGAKMPAILLETGFISHPEEGKRLQSRAYQEEAMRGVAEA
jgi:N-acetylmuramoyl-L-alanine amidase